MNFKLANAAIFVALAASSVALGHAGSPQDTVALFKNAGQSAEFFDNSYAYAVFPRISKAAIVVGGAHGSGRVYLHGRFIGVAEMTQASIGVQAGAEQYSEIIFFRDKRALDEFTSGSFEFDASAGVVAVTAGASATTGTAGAGESTSSGQKDAATTGRYRKGLAVFTIVKGGLLFDAAIAGQRFSYTSRGAPQ